MGRLHKTIISLFLSVLLCVNVWGADPKAKRVRIIDAGGYYTSTNVEGALQEVGASDISSGGSSTDNAIPRWDGTGGDTLQDSGITISDADVMSGLTDPLVNQDAATKNYVDTTLGGISFNFFLSDTATGEGAPLDVYNLMYPEETGEASSTIAVTIDTDPKLIKAFITETTEPTFTILLPGTYTLFTHAAVDATTGYKDAQIYYKLYSRTTGGTETQIGDDSELSSVLTTSSSQILLHLNVSTQTVLANTTDRLVMKLYGDTSGSGNDPEITIHMEGANDCRISVLTTLTALDSRYMEVEGDTMTGDIQLGETDIKLDAVLSGDAKWSGIVIAGVSGVTTLAVGDLCYLNADDSRWELVDANLSDGYDKQLGICVLAAADGAATEMLIYGKIRSATLPALTVGSPVYMSETAGDVTHTAPTTTDAAVRIMGFAITAEDLLFNPSNDYYTHT